MTLSPSDYEHLIRGLLPVAQKAGAVILDVYRNAFAVSYKDDSSPVTDADRLAEEVILEALHTLMPGIPVIAEEQTAAGHVPQIADLFFLVDPLDGTKEFLKRNGEFTVNIALVEGRRSVFGLVYAPDKADCSITVARGRAGRLTLQPSHVADTAWPPVFAPLVGETDPRPLRAITSRSNPRPEALAYLEKLGNPERWTMGSSLKFCVLARGEADLYPRFGPTSEWDTAAGHAILEAAGGAVVTLDGQPLAYGGKDGQFENPPFVAWRRLGLVRDGMAPA